MDDKKKKNLMRDCWVKGKVFIKFLWGMFLYIILPLFICFIFANYLWGVYVEKVGNPFNFKILWEGDTPRNALGAFGDFMGGLLNPLFAFLSLMGVLWTLKLTREGLSENRELISAQLEKQALQQFESIYLYSLDQLNILSKKIDHEKLNEIVKEKMNPPEKFGKIKNDIGVDHGICAYRDYLVLILKRLDRMNIADSEKYDYVQMITAPYTKGLVFALHISFYYLLVSQDDEILDVDLHQLLAKYNLFKNLKLINFSDAEFTYHSLGLMKVLQNSLYQSSLNYGEIVDEKSWGYKSVLDGYNSKSSMLFVHSLLKGRDNYISDCSRLSAKVVKNGVELLVDDKKIGFICFNQSLHTLERDSLQYLGENKILGFGFELYVTCQYAKLELKWLNLGNPNDFALEFCCNHELFSFHS
ncbi:MULTISPECIES: hypothetical protein [Acinetobacter]|uniref:Phage abortive infection protein n=1 Tax=Acinetobacter chengduensis TaxID=2420890 RepID=A0ABX9TZT6_9GAMM|nr:MULTISPECIES: hypothetical protein [Acinetobacter]MBI1451612.1 hypothetical protein [Acinetobacter sp. FL51]RLL24466.1 hypothetical protein D9K81_00325 [Acinetobacter chengduensis]